jgi:hypothetical protein
MSPSFACPKEGARKGHPSFTTLRANLRFSLMSGRKKTRGVYAPLRGVSDSFYVLFLQQL